MPQSLRKKATKISRFCPPQDQPRKKQGRIRRKRIPTDAKTNHSASSEGSFGKLRSKPALELVEKTKRKRKGVSESTLEGWGGERGIANISRKRETIVLPDSTLIVLGHFKKCQTREKKKKERSQGGGEGHLLSQMETIEREHAPLG